MNKEEKIRRLEQLVFEIEKNEKHEKSFDFLEKLRRKELKLKGSGEYSPSYFEHLEKTERFQVKAFLKNKSKDKFDDYAINFKEDITAELNRLR